MADDTQVPRTGNRDNFYLVAGALAPYKRVDLAVQAFASNGRKLVVAGTGPEDKKLRKIASDNIIFLGRVTDARMTELYLKAKALIFPGLEDFGIVPVEAQAMGCPIIAYGKGGALETVVEGKTGVFFYTQDSVALNQAINQFEKLQFQPKDFQKNIERFKRKVFLESIRKEVERLR